MRCMWCGSVVGQVQRTRASTESARVMSFPLGAVKDGAAGQRGNAVLTKTPRMQPSKHVHSTLVRFALGFFSFCRCSGYVCRFFFGPFDFPSLMPSYCLVSARTGPGPSVALPLPPLPGSPSCYVSAAEALVAEIVKRPLHASCRICLHMAPVCLPPVAGLGHREVACA